VVGEGVETEEQREFLRGCDCDYLQGYLIGRPVDADAAAQPYV
jgi:EAL domain-containing protein (putative c-di-GMP-specific phosphodiesterase class I)